jgi:gliding motility-associated-like protein
MKNGYENNGEYLGQPLKCQIFASAKEANTTVTVSNPRTGYSVSQTIGTANSSVSFDIPKEHAYCTASGTALDRCLLISSGDKPISLYCANFAYQSFDAANVLPYDALTGDYIVQCIPSSSYSSSDSKTAFLICALRNSTKVEITPSCNTDNGWYAGQKYEITLHQFQCYMVCSNTYGIDGDLSGTIVHSTSCQKPIAVFNGDLITAIPKDNNSARDHIFEQAMPTAYWGKQFVLTGTNGNTLGDVIRVTALEDGTEFYLDNQPKTVQYNGQTMMALDKGQTGEFELPDNTPAAFFTANNNVAVYLYQKTGFAGGNGGDPSMVWISPIEQQVMDITFSTYAFYVSSGSKYHYVNIVCRTQDKNYIKLDNINIGSQFTAVPGNPLYSYARPLVTEGTHRLQCTQGDGFTAHVYGYGVPLGYAYMVGSSMKPGTFLVNGTDVKDLPADFAICENDPIVFINDSRYEYDSLQWIIDKISPLRRVYDTISDILEYDFAARGEGAGLYKVMRVIHAASSDCYDPDAPPDTTTMLLNVVPLYAMHDTITICPKGLPYTYHGQSIASAGSYTVPLKSRYGCDSTYYLQLSVQPLGDTMDITICERDSFFFVDRWLKDPGTYIDTVTAQYGCDSVLLLHLSVRDADTAMFVDICAGDSLLFGGDYLKTSGIYRDTVLSRWGCLAEVVLTLAVHEHYARHVDDYVCAENYYLAHGFKIPPYHTAGTYHDTLFLKTVYGCDSVISLTLQVPEVTVSIVASTSDFCDEGKVILAAFTPNTQIQWNTGDTVPEIEVTKSGTYIVTVSDYGCMAQDIEIIEKCPSVVVFPNAITPGKLDGINDSFFLANTDEVKTFEIAIYDRFGTMVFYSRDPYFRWDGKVKGKYVQGVYNYLVKYITHEGIDHKITGSLTVIR